LDAGPSHNSGFPYQRVVDPVRSTLQGAYRASGSLSSTLKRIQTGNTVLDESVPGLLRSISLLIAVIL